MIAAAVLATAGPAWAQFAASLSADTDYRFRGVSLSEGRPDLALGLSYDAPDGLYAAASAVGVDGRGGPRMLGWLADAGYARRLGTSGFSADLGVQGASFTGPSDGYEARYVEIYGGLSRGPLSAHLYFSPDYFGEHVATLYLDLDATAPLGRRLRLIGHLGALAPITGRGGYDLGKTHVDVRAGLATQMKALELRLTWSTIRPGPDYPLGYAQGRDAVVLGAALTF